MPSSPVNKSNNSKSEKYFNPERVVKKVYETYDENNNKKLLRYISRGLTDQLIDKKLNKESNLNLKIFIITFNKVSQALKFPWNFIIQNIIQ